MFNKYRNIKKIGLVLIGLALVIFLITNVRIRSVDSYRKQFNVQIRVELNSQTR